MKKYSTFLLAFILLSCASKEANINELVSLYNNIDLGQSDSYLKSVFATKDTPNEVTITLAMDVESNASNQQMYASIFPQIMKEMVFSINIAKKLIKNGVIINCVMLDSNGSEIIKETFDKEYLKKDGGKTSGLLDDMNIYKMADLINSALPVEDTINGITTVKMEILNEKEAQFVYLIPDETLDLFLDNDEIAELMKLDYLGVPKQKQALKQFFALGLDKFYLSYNNTDMTRKKTIEFSKADMK